jgi:hypothetical protein
MRKLFIVGLMTLSGILASASESLAANPVTIFGDGGRIFLGCVNCDKYDNDSLNNQFSNYASQYSSESIFNPYGDYGSPYSNLSACNPNANNPPIIMDGNGNYGFLTVNRRLRNIALDPRVLGACR